MRKYIILFFLISYPICILQAQDENCKKNLELARRILFKKNPFGEQKNLFELVEPCALKGNAQAENYLGMFYLNGIETNQNVPEAFKYISNAAIKGYPAAQYNLGRLYKYGIGCELSFEKAVQWFETATENGSQRAAYTLGYMFFKGIGVTQNYEKAVYWFSQSTDLMAKHYLGLCYYLGYGVSADKGLALELLENNGILNSKTLSDYIKTNQKEKNEMFVADALDNIHKTDSTYIEPEVVSNIKIETNQNNLTSEDFIGEWTGKLLQYDWSGKIVERIIPISLKFTPNHADVIDVKILIQEEEKQATALWQDGNLFIESDLVFTFDNLYPDNPKKLSSDYKVLTLKLKQKKLLGNSYLTGDIDTFLENQTEYGQPMSVVLRGKGVDDNLNTELLEALSSQDEQFIKIYPMPFSNHLMVQYQLETTSNVYMELISLSDASKIIILPDMTQQAGEYTKNVDLNTNLPDGLYVIRLIAGNKLFTKLIIKDNN